MSAEAKREVFEGRRYLRQELADKLQVSLRTITRLIKKKGVVTVRIGGSVRIPESEVIEKILECPASTDTD